ENAKLDSRLGECESDEAVATGGLNAHQGSFLALAVRIGDPRFHVLRRRHGLAANVEDDVASSKALLSAFAAWIDADDSHALFAGAVNLARRGELQAERQR